MRRGREREEGTEGKRKDERCDEAEEIRAKKRRVSRRRKGDEGEEG